MQEVVDVAVQLKYDRIREESSTTNQQFLETIDDGMKKIIKEQVKKEVSKIIPKVEKFVNDRLESEVLIHMAIQSQLKDLEMGQMMMKNPPLEQTGGPKEEGQKGTSFYQCSSERTKTAGQTTDTDVSERPADQEFETGVQDEQAEEEVQHLPDCSGLFKRRIIAVTKVEIVEWHDYKHLDWITVRRDDDVLYNYKAVRLRYSDPMIQPEPEGSTQGYPLVSVEVLRFNTTAGNPVKKILLKLNLSDHRSILTDRKMVVEVPDFRYSDTTHLSRSVEVLKLKNFKKDATLKLSKSTSQERYEPVGPEVASSQNGKVTRGEEDVLVE
ncbi:hypothetical protein Tco_0591685 [Tanacetum coccineum]